MWYTKNIRKTVEYTRRIIGAQIIKFQMDKFYKRLNKIDLFKTLSSIVRIED